VVACRGYGATSTPGLLKSTRRFKDRLSDTLSRLFLRLVRKAATGCGEKRETANTLCQICCIQRNTQEFSNLEKCDKLIH